MINMWSVVTMVTAWLIVTMVTTWLIVTMVTTWLIVTMVTMWLIVTMVTFRLRQLDTCCTIWRENSCYIGREFQRKKNESSSGRQNSSSEKEVFESKTESFYFVYSFIGDFAADFFHRKNSFPFGLLFREFHRRILSFREGTYFSKDERISFDDSMKERISLVYFLSS